MMRFQCRYTGAPNTRGVGPDGRCPREAMRGWTMCPSHGTAGMHRRTWERIQRERETREARR